jgi:subtilisin-like proprotein convertase family protein
MSTSLFMPRVRYFFIAGFLLLCAATARAGTYKVVVLGPTGYSDSYGTSLAGTQQGGFGYLVASNKYHALLWSGSSSNFVDLNPSLVTQSFITGITTNRQAGYGDGPNTGFNLHALLWSGTAASAVDLHPAGFNQSQCQGISGNQQVGYGIPTGSGNNNHALLWTGTSNSAVDLHPSGFINSQAFGTSGNQQVGRGTTTGFAAHALMWTGTAGSAVDLHPSGFSSSQAWGTSGTQQVGVADSHAILWSGTAASAVDLNPAGYTSSFAQGISGNRQAGYGIQPGILDHALVWSGTSNSVVDLHSFLGPNYTTWSYALAVDDKGNVIGRAQTGSPSHWDAILWVYVPTPTLVLTAAALTTESCAPANGVIDPNETVTVNLTLQNTGDADASNLVATLLSTGGVTSPSSAQSFGTLVAGGAAVTRAFTFTASAQCGGKLTATFQLQTNSVNAGALATNFAVGVPFGAPVTNVYTTGGISTEIPDVTTVNIPLAVSDREPITNVKVRLRLDHTYDSDLVIDLIHPDGTMVNLASYEGSGENYGSGATNCTGKFAEFDDAAATFIWENDSPFDTTFRPEEPLSILNGKSAQGTWTLRIADMAGGDSGTLYCAQLEIARQPYACCGAAGDSFAAWQNQYFGCTTCPQAAPNADPYGKGMSNTNQFLAGFNPTNATASLRILNMMRINNDVKVTYVGANGNTNTTPPITSRTNVLEFATAVVNGSNNFTSTGQTNVLSGGNGSGMITNMIDAGGATNPSRYYRIRVLTP